jgi:hypothetical protein
MRAVLGSLFRDASLRAVPSGSASPDRPSGEPGQMPPLLTLSSDQSSEQLHKRQSSGFTQEKVCSLGFFISYLYLCLVSLQELCGKEGVIGKRKCVWRWCRGWYTTIVDHVETSRSQCALVRGAHSTWSDMCTAVPSWVMLWSCSTVWKAKGEETITRAGDADLTSEDGARSPSLHGAWSSGPWPPAFRQYVWQCWDSLWQWAVRCCERSTCPGLFCSDCKCTWYLSPLLT